MTPWDEQVVEEVVEATRQMIKEERMAKANPDVFRKAVEVIQTEGWRQGSRYGSSGPVCILNAMSIAVGNDAEQWALLTVGLPDENGNSTEPEPEYELLQEIVRERIELVPGDSAWGIVYRWNDNMATRESVIDVLEEAARRADG